MCNGVMVGFGNMEQMGYLDMLYAHPDWQRRGVDTALCNALEKNCPARVFTTHASRTARSFFAVRGYKVLREQMVLLTNFVMEKRSER